MSLRIGIDLGGTKIEVAGLDRGGREVFRKRVPTPKGDYAGTLQQIKTLIEEAGKAPSASASPAASRAPPAW